MNRHAGVDGFVTALGHVLDAEVIDAQPVSGGDVAESYRVTLAGDEVVFAKHRPGAAADFFETEALGLRWLRDAGAVAIPEVIHVGTDPPLLVLEWIESGHETRRGEAELGRSLAALHRAGSSCFGRPDRRTTGSRGLPNEPCATWVESYAVNRLIPLARLARDAAALDDHTIRGLEAIARRLDVLGGPAEPPARLHGDLWGGNRMVGADGRSWLIDPAAHGGHREFDLAMMRLFGGFGPGCFRAYGEVAPLARGWEERIELHQLAPLAVHAIKFGGGYAPATRRAVDRYL